MRHPLAQVPFFLHLDISKLVLYLTSDPTSQGSQQPCLPVCQPSIPEASPNLILCACAVALPGKVCWFYKEEGSMRLGKRMGFGVLRTGFREPASATNPWGLGQVTGLGSLSPHLSYLHYSSCLWLFWGHR